MLVSDVFWEKAICFPNGSLLLAVFTFWMQARISEISLDLSMPKPFTYGTAIQERCRQSVFLTARFTSKLSRFPIAYISIRCVFERT